jgi:hypothetical protein
MFRVVLYTLNTRRKHWRGIGISTTKSSLGRRQYLFQFETIKSEMPARKTTKRLRDEKEDTTQNSSNKSSKKTSNTQKEEAELSDESIEFERKFRIQLDEIKMLKELVADQEARRAKQAKKLLQDETLRSQAKILSDLKDELTKTPSLSDRIKSGISSSFAPLTSLIGVSPAAPTEKDSTHTKSTGSASNLSKEEIRREINLLIWKR